MAKIHPNCIFLRALLVLIASAGTTTCQTTLRVISGLGGYIAPVGIVEGAPNVFYSTGTQSAFSVTVQGKVTGLASFPNGDNLNSQLVSAADAQLYSVDVVHGSPTAGLFSVGSQPGTERTYPQQSVSPSLSQNLPNGSLLGGGCSLVTNVCYLVTAATNGAVTPVYQLPANNYSLYPIYGADGNYYGVGWSPLGAGPSYVYQLTPSGSFKTIYNLPNGSIGSLGIPVPLIQATDGNFYGVTPYGGNNGGWGTFYKVTPAGQYTLLYSFSKGPGAYPHALIQASDGNFYGASLGYAGPSLLFRFTASGQFTALHELPPGNGQCTCFLTQGSDGVIYGMAQNYGPTGAGTFFALDAGLAKPAPRELRFTPQSGAPGTKVLIWGYNLLSPSVDFNGVAATTVTSSGPNYVWATVPEGAVTGPITVTTPGGTATTALPFTVE